MGTCNSTSKTQRNLIKRNSIESFNDILFKTISGKQFNQLCLKLGITPVKLTNKTENHNGFQFKDGPNDIADNKEEFNPTKQCSSGGIYITDLIKFGEWTYYNDKMMEYIRRVTIPDDAFVYIEKNKYKVNKVFLHKRETIWDNESHCMAAVKQNRLVHKYVKNQTPELCMAAVKQDGRVLEYVRNQTPELCMAAVKQDGRALYFVKNQTPELCMAAVKQNGLVLKYVKNQTPELYMAAVKQNGLVLKYVKNQTPELCMAAVKQNGLVLKYVKNQTPELCMAAIKQDGRAIEYVRNQTLQDRIKKELNL